MTIPKVEDGNRRKFCSIRWRRFEAADFADALEEFEENIPVFTSNRTEVVTQGGMTEIGTGEAESVISQADADKIATAIARRKASKALESALPKIVSLGAIANSI
jgi:hypothetical protein